MIVGLTGGIACGKSTVANLFRELGCPIVDADQVAREVVEPGTTGLKRVLERFGEDLLRDDGTLDRKGLGKVVFNDKKALAELNAILHPLISERMNEKKEEALKLNPPFVMMDIPLLYESKRERLVEFIIVVYVPVQVQLERLMQGDQFTLEEAQLRIASQMDIEEKKKRADFVIDNSGSLESTRKQVEEIYSTLCKE